MKVILSFDTEDFVTPEAADAQLWWAGALTRRNLRGSFQCVAELIRRLKSRGRLDVVAALAKHEIGYHSQFHSMPPVHPPAVEKLTLAEGIAWVMRREAAGLAVLVETFGRMPVSYCPPGNSWTPATLLAMAAMGIKLFVGNIFPRPCWYCGLLGARYDLAFEAYFGGVDKPEETFRRDFEARAKRAGPDGLVILYSHPTRLVTSRFWDAPLYGGSDIPMDAMPPAPLYTPAVAARNRELAEGMLDWVMRHPAVELTDCASLYAQRAGRRDLPALLQESGLKPGEEGLLPLRDDDTPPEDMKRFFERFTYRWPLFPPGFTGEALKRQMRQLAWTLQPA